MQVRRLASLDEDKIEPEDLPPYPDPGDQPVKLSTDKQDNHFGKIPSRRVPQVLLRRPQSQTEDKSESYSPQQQQQHQQQTSFVPSSTTLSNKNGIYSASKLIMQPQPKSFLPSKQFNSIGQFSNLQQPQQHQQQQHQRQSSQLIKSPLTVTSPSGRVVYVVTSPNR